VLQGVGRSRVAAPTYGVRADSGLAPSRGPGTTEPALLHALDRSLGVTSFAVRWRMYSVAHCVVHLPHRHRVTPGTFYGSAPWW